MKSKTIAIALASVLVAPFVLANPSKVLADGKRGQVPSAASSRTNLEAEMRYRAADVRVEAEVEFGQGTVNNIVKTKLGAEVEIVLVNPVPAPDATLIDATINVGPTATCKFLNDPHVSGPFTVGAKKLYRVDFHGSVAQSGTDPVAVKGLECDPVTIPAIALGDSASVVISGLPGGDVTVPSSTFVKD